MNAAAAGPPGRRGAPMETDMAAKERIVYQPYTRGAKGRLAAGAGIACRTPEEGARRAEKAMAAGSVIGAHVVRIMADEEAGDYGEPEFIATYGEVPPTE